MCMAILGPQRLDFVGETHFDAKPCARTSPHAATSLYASRSIPLSRKYATTTFNLVICLNNLF